MAERGINLRWTKSRYVYGQHDGIRVRFDVVSACDMPTHIFAYRSRPTDPHTGAQAGFFSHVCSPVDIEEFPENEARLGESPQWFRLDYVDLLVRSIDEADALIEDVLEDVQRLKTTLDALEIDGETQLVTIGDDCVAASSSSSPSSSSSAVSSSSTSSGGSL